MQSKMRALETPELLVAMPLLQRLMERLMDCLPRGVAARDFVVQVGLKIRHMHVPNSQQRPAELEKQACGFGERWQPTWVHQRG